MLYVQALSYGNDSCLVCDTKDSSSEWISIADLKKVVKAGYQVAGVMKDGSHTYLRAIGDIRDDLIQYLKAEFRRGFDIHKTAEGVEARDLGSWVVPEDARYDYPDEDFEDWDWCEPTEDTMRRVRKVLKKCEEQLCFTFTVEVGEKNWMYFAPKERV